MDKLGYINSLLITASSNVYPITDSPAKSHKFSRKNIHEIRLKSLANLLYPLITIIGIHPARKANMCTHPGFVYSLE